MNEKTKKEELEEKIVEMYKKIAFADLGDFLEFDRRVEVDSNGEETIISEVNIKEKLPDDFSAVSSITTSKGAVKVTFYDRMKALEWLSRHFGIDEETTDTEGGVVIVPDVEKSVRELTQEGKESKNERRTQEEEHTCN